jgi:1-acyl-sn-glycerol-3-phosphate acyltransferase
MIYFWSLLLALFGIWFLYWCYQGWMISLRSGHYAPMISAAPRLLRWGVGCLVARLFVGEVTIKGWENVAKCKGRMIIAPKHVSFKDAALVAKLARTYKLRFLIAITQVQGWAWLKWFRAPPVAWMGGISVGYDKSNPALAGANAAKAAVKAMTSEPDSILVIFPEGQLDKKNELVRKNYRGGFVRIGKGCQNIDHDVWYGVPVDLEYHRGGATVTFGVPVPFAHLPDNEQLATDYMFDLMVQMRAGNKATQIAMHGQIYKHPEA